MAEAKKRTIKKTETAEKPSDGSNYFTKPASTLEFINSGCESLNQALGGGWAIGRASNIIGDNSTGKTLLAIEACANFHRDYPDGKIVYIEAEAAFDQSYAEALGMPVNEIDFRDNVRTVEDLYTVIDEETKDKKTYILIVVDSLDALSSEAEGKRKIDEASFGGEKSKKLGELFRRQVSSMEDSNTHLMVISQVRENIGVTFGAKYKRSGGKALDFYMSQIIMLAHTGQIKKTKKGVERTIGVDIKAKVTKNKVGIPFREAEFPIYFGYGVDDIAGNCRYLQAVGSYNTSMEEIPKTKKDLDALLRDVATWDDDDYFDFQRRAKQAVIDTWPKVEQEFVPTRRKY